MDLQLKEKVVLVSGGSSGIGEAAVRAFADEGALVAIVDRDAERGARLAKEIPLSFFFETDLCDPQACERAVRQVLDRWQRMDVLVNNAGVNDAVGLTADPSDFETSLQRNLVHYFVLVQQSAAALRQHAGAIVNVGSKVSITGQGGTSGYAAAKGAINALTREWAVEFAESGVRVNTVIPAEVWTPMYERWIQGKPEGVAEKKRIEQRIPLQRRFTTPEEIANTVVFLASPASGHTTGQIIHVDGGYVHLDRRIG